MTNPKFRGWDTVAKRMLSPDDLCELDIFLSPSGQGFFQKIGHRIIPFPTIIPLRFTGRVDKNGVEIYEGYRLFGSIPDAIDQEYVIEWRDHLSGFDCHGASSGCIMAVVPVEWAEVIGNIYEGKTK